MRKEACRLVLSVYVSFGFATLAHADLNGSTLREEAIHYFEARLGEQVLAIDFGRFDAGGNQGYVALSSQTLCELFVADELKVDGEPVVSGVPFREMNARCVPFRGAVGTQLDRHFQRAMNAYVDALADGDPSPLVQKILALSGLKSVHLEGTPKLHVNARPLYRIGAGALARRNLLGNSPSLIASGFFRSDGHAECQYAVLTYSYLWELMRRFEAGRGYFEWSEDTRDVAKLARELAEKRSLSESVITGHRYGPMSGIVCPSLKVHTDPDFRSILP